MLNSKDLGKWDILEQISCVMRLTPQEEKNMTSGIVT